MSPRKKKQEPTPEQEIAAPSGISRMVAFHLGTQRYAFPIDSVQEIQQIVAFAEVPDESGAVRGMINLRGRVVPALDLRQLLGMEARDYSLETPMVICRSEQGPVAFIVDGVDDVTELPEGCLQPAPQVHSLAGRMLGVCRLEEGMTFLLDVDRVMDPVELHVEEVGDPA